MYVSNINSVVMGYNGSAANYITNLQTPNLTVPENVILFIGIAFLIPYLVNKYLKKKEGLIYA